MVENHGIFALFFDFRALQGIGGAAGEKRVMRDYRRTLAYGRDPASISVS